ncbi:MAG TPA: UDP-N-acetylglucosamine 4,6-dehydratase [Candidatus Bathyarchaeia archaeon]|nr:UDP-N-acetylglucosamine 4,6-dehydratase [Candidatus Bathyarchaeia archaeon]
MNRPFEAEFGALFPERNPLHPDDFNNFAVAGCRVLVTGAGGSIGSALAQRILREAPQRLILLDHSEQALYALRCELNGCDRADAVRFVLADIRDDSLMQSVLAEKKPDFIFHVAAFKHVPLLEENPFAAIENNGLATWRLARSAAKFRVSRLLLISTDKAANPRSMLGVSKRLAELAILRWHSSRTRMSALRLGNVAGSSGSVLPIFRDQILRGGPVTVTHREATRYFLTMAETCAAIGTLANLPDAAGLYLPAMSEPVFILDLAKRMIRAAAAVAKTHAGTSVRVTRLRPGDKLHEDLLSIGETAGAEAAPGMRAIHGEKIHAKSLDAQFRVIAEIAKRRDLGALLDLLRQLVPEYQPTAQLAKTCAVAAGAGDD